ncbi:MAG: hypothetical protein FWE89_01345 [Syntrophaceae bacterium]|nr:hypothetical protein [Syntrophaceae bacterium]
MKILKQFLQNRNTILLLALAFGLAVPYAAQATRNLILPALALIMILSTLEIGDDFFRRPRTLFFPALLGIVMSYIILGNLLIGLSSLLILNEKLWIGFALLAAAPPAIAVVAFSSFLNASRFLSLVGTVGAYMGALAIMPLFIMGLLYVETANLFKLVLILLGLIVLPWIFSRLLIQKRWGKQLVSHHGLITNWCFFIVLYTMVGLNRSLILGDTARLLPVLLITFVSMFLLGILIDWIATLLRLPMETRMSLVLLGTLKNQGLAGGIALTLFTPEAALPSVVSTILMIAFIIWLGVKKRWE